MLKPAQLYKEELEKLFLRTWYDLNICSIADGQGANYQQFLTIIMTLIISHQLITMEM